MKSEKVRPEKEKTILEKITKSTGSWPSIVLHTFIFAAFLVSPFFGIPLETSLLVLTTLVSLEAIYLALFIQMSVNQNTTALENVEEDIEEIQEDVEDIQEEIEEIGEDVEDITETQEKIEKEIDEIQEDVEDIQEEVEDLEEDSEEEKTRKNDQKIRLEKIESTLETLLNEINNIKNK